MPAHQDVGPRVQQQRLLDPAHGFLTDQAVAALASRDPAAAEALAASLLVPEILHDIQILGAAVEAGIDTSTWEERREKIRTYARDAYELPPQFDPAIEAKRIWASLYDNYPQIAAAHRPPDGL
ncbi:hypothetical protein ABZU45_42845 [Streptomyces avermitilis]|uniref:hypothetical protein n=1 Tax=Streptomyces avermitilis TaxID=33903 RepID=UPI0033B3BE58